MPVTFISRRTCLGSSFDRMLYRTRLLTPGDDLRRLITQVLQPDLRPGDIMLIASKAVSACQGRLLPLTVSRPGRLARELAAVWRRLANDAPLGHVAAMQAALDQHGAIALLGQTANRAWRSLGGSSVDRPPAGPAGLLRVGDEDDLPIYHGQLILPPRQPRDLVAALWKETGYRLAIVAVRQPGAVQIAALSPGLSPEYIQQLVLDNPLGNGRQQTPVAIIRKRQRKD